MIRVVAICFDQIIQFVVGWAVVDFVEVDGVANPSGETTKSVLVLWNRVLVV